MTRSEAKSIAKNNLKGNWTMALVTSLIYTLIIGLLASTYGIAQLLLGSVFLVGYNFAFISAATTRKYEIENLFVGLKTNVSNRVVLSVMKNIFIFLWALLFIIPGIVKSYSYYLAEYISLQHPDYDYKQCLKESEEKMKGHRWELFVLQLSFIGWALLCLLTLGIGYLWLEPYIKQTEVEYINANIMQLYETNVVNVNE